MRIATLIILMALSGVTCPASAQIERTPDVETPGSYQAGEWIHPDLGRGIIEGYADQAFIWLRSAETVVRFDRATGERKVVSDTAVDLMPDGSHLWVLNRGTNYQAEIIDLRASEPAFLRINLREGGLLGLFQTGENRPGILSSETAYTPSARGWDHHALAATITGAPRIAFDGRASLYIGFNRGEWGGGLRRADLQTGAVSFVTRSGEGLCGGDLNPACDPVVGLFPDEEAGCVIVGAGLSHMGVSMGHVYRVCGDEITTVFDTPQPDLPDRWMMMPAPWPLDGLTQTRGGWIGTSRGRYFSSRDGRVDERSYPPFDDWSGLRISDETEGVLFVVGACCWGSADRPTLFRALVVPVLD